MELFALGTERQRMQSIHQLIIKPQRQFPPLPGFLSFRNSRSSDLLVRQRFRIAAYGTGINSVFLDKIKGIGLLKIVFLRSPYGTKQRTVLLPSLVIEVSMELPCAHLEISVFMGFFGLL